jgi:hypothetical protein
MSEAEPKIEIIKPFEDAFELMKKILFQPFDLKKWFVIGFAGWLARIGAGFNFNYRYNNKTKFRDTPLFQSVAEAIQGIPFAVIVIAVITLIILVLALVVLFAWLRARGRFMFIDCIVKNRAAIEEPWRQFRNEGNSYFFFSFLIGCGFALVAVLLSLPFMLPIVRGVTFLHLHDVYLISMIVLWATAVMLIAFAWALVAHIMVAVMYRRRCSAIEGFRAASALVSNYPGEITLYCLFWIALGIGTVIAACVVLCATCCIAALPYIGTVILLPVYVCLRAFSLLFLRQFGPDYDVWAGLPQPKSPPIQPPPLPA